MLTDVDDTPEIKWEIKGAIFVHNVNAFCRYIGYNDITEVAEQQEVNNEREE